jgi:hypothetical protein
MAKRQAPFLELHERVRQLIRRMFVHLADVLRPASQRHQRRIQGLHDAFVFFIEDAMQALLQQRAEPVQ